MRQFYEAYQGQEEVSPLVTQLPWTHHLILLSQTKRSEERKFHLLAAIKGRWTKRELERQIRTGAALRGASNRKKVSPAMAQIHPAAAVELKNEYSLELITCRSQALVRRLATRMPMLVEAPKGQRTARRQP